MLALVGCGVAWAGSATPVHEAWVPLGTDVPGAVRDHGRRIEADGTRWVRWQGPADALRRHGGQPVPPPPEGYSDPDGATRRLRAAVASAPSAGTVVVGHSEEGRALTAAWFGPPPGEAPAVWAIGGHHGDEGLGWELALALAETLAAREGIDDAVLERLDARTVWVVPIANPDGVVAGHRTNAAGLDLNRTYDVAWWPGMFAGDAPFEPVETRRLASWGDGVRPAVGLALHSGAHNLGWVWNHTETPAPDAVALEGLALDYADALGIDDFWVTPGAAWYVTHGDQNDWAYGRMGTWDFTLEVGEPKSPPLDEALERVAAHVPVALSLLATPLDRVQVVDAVDGLPVEAWLEAGGQRRWSDPVSGWVGWVPGAGPPTVGAPGYRTREVNDGTVALERSGLVLGEARVVAVGAALPAAWGYAYTLMAAGRAPLEVLAGEPVPGPGPWTVVDTRGRVHPHALFGVEGVAEEADRDLDGARGFLGGEAALVEVAPDAPEAEVVWSAGRWLAARPLDSTTIPGEGLRVVGVGCHTTTNGWHLLAWLVSLVCVARRQV